jgi:hypothetical protein
MTEVQLNISVLTPRHLEQVLAINNANAPAVSELIADELKFLVEHSLYALIITDVSGDNVRAFCLTFAPGVPYTSSNYQWFSERYDNFVYLDRIAVASQHQNKGCGTALYGAVERQMIRDRTSPLLTCEVNLQPPNPGSLRFHERLGFNEVGQQESKPGLIVRMLAKQLT